MQRGRAQGTDIRLGYLLSKNAWGKGIASELVAGFAVWCRGQSTILTIFAGVAQDNLASVRVLEKTGFDRVGREGEIVDGDHLYQLILR